MTTLFIAFKLLWKRKLANITLVLQIMLSIIMLAQLFVFIADHADNMRAVNELPVKNTIVLHVFDYYTVENVTQQIKSSPQIDSVGSVAMSAITCKDIPCNLAVYSESIISRYTPTLESGSWLSDWPAASGDTIPAVISDDFGLKAGNTIEIQLPNGKVRRITIVGILGKPTQYLYPYGSASPAYFTAKSVISQDPVVIIRDTDLQDTSIWESSAQSTDAKNLFIFLKPEVAQADVDAAMKMWNRYGETTPMQSLISTYNKDTNKLIGSGTIMFVVFLLLAVTGVLSNHVIQTLRNRRLFTVYYLLGMNGRKGAVIELYRLVILVLITMALSFLAGKCGLLMVQWMTPERERLFYGVAFLYVVIMFSAVGAGSLLKLMREDISGTFKELQQGE
jgi:hypothetical protein